MRSTQLVADADVNCRAGFYKVATSSGKSFCTPCDAGFANPTDFATSASACVPCDAGLFSPLGASRCTVQCPIGTGSTGSSLNSAACMPCPAGLSECTSSTQPECRPGYYRHAATNVCIACAPGSANFYTGAWSDQSCVACPAGLVSAAGADLCTGACPIGTGVIGTSPTPQACLPCTDGKAVCGSSVGSSNLCAAGFFAQGGGCAPCVGGTASSTVGATSPSTCQVCAATLVSPAGAAACQATCPVGFTINGTMGSSCVGCQAGTFKNDDRSNTCVPCPAGTYSRVVGATACTRCSSVGALTMSPAGAAQCALQCPAGHAPDPTDPAACLPCPAGTFSSSGLSCAACTSVCSCPVSKAPSAPPQACVSTRAVDAGFG